MPGFAPHRVCLEHDGVLDALVSMVVKPLSPSSA
jgi:hypothetical protein